MKPSYRVGLGFDSHRFSSQPDRQLKLGGISIPDSPGLAGHSDADVLLHAITDALLGALALPDIGTLFPDTDPQYHNIDSTSLLTQIVEKVTTSGYHIDHLDCIVICDEPKLSPFAQHIRNQIANLMGLPLDAVGLQAKTCEGTLLAIPQESIAAFAVVILRSKSRRRASKKAKHSRFELSVQRR